MNPKQVLEHGFPVPMEEVRGVELALLLYHDTMDLHLFFLDEDLFHLLGLSPAGATFRIDVLAVVFKRDETFELFTVEGVSAPLPVDPESGRLAAWWREQVAVARGRALAFCSALTQRYPFPLLKVTNPLEIAAAPSDTRVMRAIR